MTITKGMMLGAASVAAGNIDGAGATGLAVLEAETKQDASLALGLPLRHKSEVTYSGVNLAIPITTTNLLTLLNTLTPSSGTLTPFFDVATGKLKVFDTSSTVTFKLNMLGSWAGAPQNRSIELNFVGSLGNNLVVSRNPATTIDTVTMPTFFSVDAGGNLATNGSVITIKSNTAVYTATDIVLIAEQMVPQ